MIFHDVNKSFSTTKYFFPIYIHTDRNNSWLRFRYGRLSMDSDDQNSNRKCDSDDNILVEYKVNVDDDINDNEEQYCIKNQYLDGNGNQVTSDKGQNQNDNNKVVECSCMERTTIAGNDTTIANHTNEDNQINDKIMKKLQAMSISDDDYGKFNFMSLEMLFFVVYVHVLIYSN